MRERLIELIRGARKTTKGANCDLEREGLFADYLIANGVIVPPCKVGDKVWFTCKNMGEVYEAMITHIDYSYYTSPQEWITVEYDSPHFGRQSYTSRIDLMFGEVIFFTREEAEQALKGGEG